MMSSRYRKVLVATPHGPAATLQDSGFNRNGAGKQTAHRVYIKLTAIPNKPHSLKLYIVAKIFLTEL